MIKELFIDRKEHLQQLTHGLKHGKDFVLIAPRRYGKTTLAEKILHDIQQDPHYLTIHIDMMRYSGSVQSIAEGIIEHCLNALDIMVSLSMGLDPYNNSTISRQTIHAVLKNLEDSGFISKTERAVYVIADPLLASYLSH